MTALSLRRLWTMYKRVLGQGGVGKRDLRFTQGAFYAGARSTLKVLDYMLEHGNDNELRETIHNGKVDRSRLCRNCALERGGTEELLGADRQARAARLERISF